MDFETQLPTWLQSVLKDNDQLLVIGRAALMLTAGLVMSLVTWLTTKVGWWGLKGSGRVARACWPGGRADPLAAQLTQEFLASLERDGCKDKQLQKILFMEGGCVDLAEQKVFLGLEDLKPVLSRRQYKTILRVARRIYDRLSAEQAQAHKEKLLAKLRPPEAQGAPPATLQECREDEIRSRFVNVFGETP